MKINLNNIEEIVFFNKEIQRLLPEFRPLFDQWALGKRIPGMANMAQRSLLEFLNSLDKPHIQKLEEYFGDIITVDKLDSNLVKHYDGEVDDLELCLFEGYQELCLYRKKGHLYISAWR